MISPTVIIIKRTKKTKVPKEGKTRKIKPQKDIEKRTDSKEKEAMNMHPDGSNRGKIEQLGKIEKFRRMGISFLEELGEDALSEMIQETNQHYYNTQTPLLSDAEYDILKEYVERKYPQNRAVKEVGASVTGKNRVPLPYEMASMDKIKPDTGALAKWTKRYTGPYVLSCKLDGVSGLYVCGTTKTPKLYTRGDGKVGQDVSHLLKSLKLPRSKKQDIGGDLAVRGEFVIRKEVFLEKYQESFANARNLVSGIINRKTADPKTADLHFVAYEVIHPHMKPSEQLAYLVDRGFEVVRNQNTPTLTNTALSALLLQWREEYEYEIDGVIVTDDRIYPRKEGNPEHAFAFKMVISDQQAEAKVVDVVWPASKDGYLKPRVKLETIRLGGVKIEYAKGFNAKFIQDNRIGIGAIVQLVRSGDVIPYIMGVTTPAETPKMPSVPYIWNDTVVDVILQNPQDDETVQEKTVAGFFTHLEVDGLAKGNVARLFAAGFRTVATILKMSKSDFETVEGFKAKTIDKIYHSIHEKVGRASLLDIMVASNRMGRGLGERKIGPILEAYPDVLTPSFTNKSPKEKEAALMAIKGIGKENAHDFVEHIPVFLAFLEECGLTYKIGQMDEMVGAVVADHPLNKKKIVMTKVRDKAIIDALAKYGATLENSMTKDVFALIVKSHTDTSSKTEYAKKHGIPIMTAEEFVSTYL